MDEQQFKNYETRLRRMEYLLEILTIYMEEQVKLKADPNTIKSVSNKVFNAKTRFKNITGTFPPYD